MGVDRLTNVDLVRREHSRMRKSRRLLINLANYGLRLSQTPEHGRHPAEDYEYQELSSVTLSIVIMIMSTAGGYGLLRVT